ncbi:unnamed protein product [Symbiodinium necroappetens]|uniref:Uncharacterized protein n=1 Tax=Symbiodinium necroappetens TaxID=1628268 RepID=A0A812W081_9DINO|nr:unnamed protein product [Symbiodinium necroappetens]
MTRRVFLVVLLAAALRGARDQLAAFLSVRLRPTMRLKVQRGAKGIDDIRSMVKSGSISADVAINMTQLLAAKDNELALKDKDNELAAKDNELALAAAAKDNELALVAKDIEMLKLQLDTTEKDGLQAASRYAAILCNRFLVETGLRKFGPKLTLTNSYDQFSRQYILSTSSKAPSLTPAADMKLQELQQVTGTSGTSVDRRHVTKELQILVHQLSRETHYVQNMEETRYLVGGSEPTASATAVVVCFLQAQKLLEMNVTFVGANYSKLAVLSGGNVTSP